MFFSKLDWKAQLSGGTIIKVPPAYTSQTCRSLYALRSKESPDASTFQVRALWLYGQRSTM